MPATDPQLFTLSLSLSDGRYAAVHLDESVSEDPEFLVAAVRAMKRYMAKMPEPNLGDRGRKITEALREMKGPPQT